MMKSDLDYRKRMLDTLSPSFCGAKWYNATIWLGSGMTTSCHHPPAHLVDANKVADNPKLLHNTDQKKEDRRMMQAGERPPGCEYCWKIEDMGRDAVSDRVYKSKIYNLYQSTHKCNPHIVNLFLHINMKWKKIYMTEKNMDLRNNQWIII